MDTPTLELNQKIDALMAQVAYLTEQAQAAERERQERDELLETVKPIAKDAMQMATRELAEVQDDLDPSDLVRLLKKIARHRATFEMLVDQIDAVTDLVDVAGPITKEGMDLATRVAGELEQKGYFAFARGGIRLADNVVTSFSEADVNRLADNIVLILNVVKEMTQPEIMSFLHSTLLVAEEEIEKPVDISYLSLVRQMRDPAVRRGLALTLRVLHVIGAQAGKEKI